MDISEGSGSLSVNQRAPSRKKLDFLLLRTAMALLVFPSLSLPAWRQTLGEIQYLFLYFYSSSAEEETNRFISEYMGKKKKEIYPCVVQLCSALKNCSVVSPYLTSNILAAGF